ncbi:MAG TPA: hypothetical protein VFZ65_16255 [Planctomycetota bacterium]|nr:hypothetical protein [Planctomycetota bacterium]
MAGWFMRASVSRSLRNREIVFGEHAVVCSSLIATSRRIGSRCSARKTTPNAPAPIWRQTWYGPIAAGTCAGAAVAGSASSVAARS